MPVTVRILGLEAVVSGREWSCADADAERFLNAMSPRPESMRYSPDYDYSIAEAVINRLGGEIVGHEPPEPSPEDDEDTVH